jgi:biotin carboxyl carrier protein
VTRSAWRDGDRERVVDLERLADGRWKVVVDGVALEIDAEPAGPGRLLVRHPGGASLVETASIGNKVFVRLDRMDFVLARGDAAAAGSGRRARRAGHAGGLESPMPGVVTRVMIAAGDEVRKGQPLLAVEAMKMEHVIRAPHDGRVKRIAAAAGELVEGGVVLVELDGAG